MKALCRWKVSMLMWDINAIILIHDRCLSRGVTWYKLYFRRLVQEWCAEWPVKAGRAQVRRRAWFCWASWTESLKTFLTKCKSSLSSFPSPPSSEESLLLAWRASWQSDPASVSRPSKEALSRMLQHHPPGDLELCLCWYFWVWLNVFLSSSFTSHSRETVVTMLI